MEFYFHFPQPIQIYVLLINYKNKKILIYFYTNLIG